jgi:HK97 family phage portal protein
MGLRERFSLGRKAVPESKSVSLPELIRRMSNGGSDAPSSPAQAVGIPAVYAAIRLLAETGAMLPQIVYRDTGRVRERAPDSPQWTLLHKRPARDYTAYDWRSDAYSSLVGFGNFYARKIIAGSGARKRVFELVPFDPRTVSAEWRDGQIVYTVTPFDGRGGKGPETLTRAEMFHVRGFTLHGEAKGLSPIAACRAALASGVGLEDYLAGFLRNDATPGGVLEFPGTVSQTEADDIVDVWNRTHGGAENAGKVGLLGGGAQWKSIGMSLQDAQFVEQHKFSVSQVARMFGLPIEFLAEGKITAESIRTLVTFGIGPWYTRFDSALNADLDVFPEATGLFAETLADALLRPDAPTRYRAYKDARQGSWVTANEIRAFENLPPIDGGDEIQVTPVGGAPNPDNDPDPDKPDEPSGDTEDANDA